MNRASPSNSTSDLWAPKRAEARAGVEPLAVRMRPRTLDELVGQTHIVGEGKLLRRMIDADAITSLILHGPPGTGKTTLAEVIANATNRRFVRENAASVGVKRIRELIADADRSLGDTGKRTILFLDEIHRFTKAQQDVLLADVERGLITLIGATTENPLFSVNSALISRSTLFRVEALSEAEVIDVLERAVADPQRGYGKLDLEVTPGALRVWAIKSEGDARRALTALEVAVLSTRGDSDGTDRRRDRVGAGDLPASGVVEEGHRERGAGRAGGAGSQATILIDEQTAEDSIQAKVATYGDDGHYDAISAMIKSVRGSDPDAAVYWIARMLDAGEDPRFIARRLAILASEDVGNADPRAVVIASSCWELVERIGMPEARITLGQCATYLALAPKSNAAYQAIDAALADVREGRVQPVPLYLRDKNTSPLANDEGKGQRVRTIEGEGYEYSHNSEDQISGQSYMGVDKRYYEPKDIGAERVLRERLDEIRATRERSGKRS
ncbi:MAG: ATPase AAA [Phycisphaeraceae bacterium]|nr:MAG: ATPase AAA [Phycisphaeraceae bacterium]